MGCGLMSQLCSNKDIFIVKLQDKGLGMLQELLLYEVPLPSRSSTATSPQQFSFSYP